MTHPFCNKKKKNDDPGIQSMFALPITTAIYMVWTVVKCLLIKEKNACV